MAVLQFFVMEDDHENSGRTKIYLTDRIRHSVIKEKTTGKKPKAEKTHSWSSQNLKNWPLDLFASLRSSHIMRSNEHRGMRRIHARHTPVKSTCVWSSTDSFKNPNFICFQLQHISSPKSFPNRLETQGERQINRG